jgi:hypothetical protein
MTPGAGLDLGFSPHDNAFGSPANFYASPAHYQMSPGYGSPVGASPIYTVGQHARGIGSPTYTGSSPIYCPAPSNVNNQAYGTLA